MRLPHLDLHY